MKGKLPALGYTPTLALEDTTRDREFWLSRPDLSEETRQNLRAADILIVPEGDDYRGQGIFFPEGTTEFYHYLLSQNVSVEVAADEDDFKELARHFDLYILGEFVLTVIAVPIFKDILTKHLENRLLNSEKSAIKIGLTIQKADGSAKRLTYEGPANDFESEIGPLLQGWLDDSTPPPPALPPAPDSDADDSETDDSPEDAT